MAKNLAVFLDGTWNDPTDNTNVWRLKTLVARRDAEGKRQLAYYATGVGTRWYDRVRGGIGGFGMSENIVRAYRWIVEHHDEGDRIFIFGFSRGAFTARSVAGLVASCGLLRPGAAMSVDEVYARYRKRAEAKPLYRLEFEQNAGRTDFDDDDRWLLENSRRVPIRFTGIWDTVGTLGIPFGNIPGISRKQFTFHNTRLSKIFERGCQALALDEHRKPYDATLWTNFLPLNSDGEIVDERRANSYYPHFKQRWFVGAHSNIGGGYPRDTLAQIPLRWIQDNATSAGLHFRSPLPLRGDEHLGGEVVDSYGKFLKGAYRLVKLGRRHRREIGRPAYKVRNGFVESVNESIDASVIDRWQKDPDYRPQNLRQWADRAGQDLDHLPPASVPVFK